MTLTPPDPRQCQAEKPSGYSFMTLGGSPGYVRCRNRPTVIATERTPGPDGLRGRMSLCDECQRVLLRQSGPNFADFTPIAKEFA